MSFVKPCRHLQYTRLVPTCHKNSKDSPLRKKEKKGSPYKGASDK